MPADKPAETVMRRLWQRMAEIYGHRWTSAYGDDAGSSAGETWAKGLAGLTSAHFATGIEAALISAEDWPPTLPRFRAMCLGIPSMESVVAALSRRDGSSRTRFERCVWGYIVDPWAHAHMASDRAHRDIEQAYRQARSHIMAGGDLPAVPAGEIEHSHEPVVLADIEVSKANCAAILAGLANEQQAAA